MNNITTFQTAIIALLVFFIAINLLSLVIQKPKTKKNNFRVFSTLFLISILSYSFLDKNYNTNLSFIPLFKELDIVYITLVLGVITFFEEKFKK
jgi:hypothetical protein